MDQVASSPEQVDPSGQNDEALHEDLEEAVRTTLRDHGLPVDDDAVAYVVETVTCARWCAAERLERPKLLKRDATRLRNNMRSGLRIVEALGVASPAELGVLRRFERFAECDIQAPRSQFGPKIRPWLWFWCLELLFVWRRLTNRPDGVWMRDEPSPALAFLEDCCRLVDPTVNASAILNAKKKDPDPNSPPPWRLTPEEFMEQQTAAHTYYGQIWTERVGAKTAQT